MTQLPTYLIFLSILFTSSTLWGQSPCDSKGHRAFDFWVGEWTVYKTGTDTIAGHSHIKNILNGCVIEENWTGRSGFQGKSFNTYNPQDSTWNQVWVDVSGNTYHFSGTCADNIMDMSGKTINKAGKKILFKMSYHYDPEKKTVQQVWKSSADAGKSWTVIFNGIYVKQ